MVQKTITEVGLHRLGLKSTEVILRSSEVKLKSNEAVAELDFNFAEMYLFLLLRVQLQCNIDELGGMSIEAIAELDLSLLRVNIVWLMLVHQVQL